MFHLHGKESTEAGSQIKYAQHHPDHPSGENITFNSGET